MTDREAVHLLNRVNRRHALLTAERTLTNVLTTEQITAYSHEREVGLSALTNAGYSLEFVTSYPRSRYVMHEPAEALAPTS